MKISDFVIFFLLSFFLTGCNIDDRLKQFLSYFMCRTAFFVVLPFSPFCPQTGKSGSFR